MKKQNVLLAFVAVAAGVALLLSVVGCKVQDPGTRYADQPPETLLSKAPVHGDTVNHYLDLSWEGNDGDGTVVGYKLFVDNVLVSYTTATDTTMAFDSPVDSGVRAHSVLVVAVDDEGTEDPYPFDNRALTDTTIAADSTYAYRLFYTVNYAPSLAFDEEASVGEGQTVSPGFRLTLVAADTNRSLFYYSVSFDNENWTPWTTDSLFLFGSRQLHTSVADSSFVEVDDDNDGTTDEEQENGRDDDGDGRVDEDTRGLYPDRSYVVAIDADQSGSLHVWARVKDAGDAVSAVINREVTLNPALRPSMDSTVVGIYGTRNLYPDGSQYFQRRMDIETSFAFSASYAQASAGLVNSYRYQRGDIALGDTVWSDSAWSNWIPQGELAYLGLPAGGHRFRLVGRDLAGNVTSDTLTYTVRLVEAALRRKVVIVDESADNNITREAGVDSFYAALFSGYETEVIDYVERGSYLSPYDLSDAGLLVYHAEDRADPRLSENVRVLTDYLSHGGRMVLSGWDLLRSLTGARDSILTFSAGAFAHDYLKLNSAECTGFAVPARYTRGWTGVAPYPDCGVDTVYIHQLISRNGAEQTWTFRPQGQCRVIGNLVVSNPSDPVQARYAGLPTAYVYDQSYRIAVFGFPLYFVDHATAIGMMDGLAEELMQGLSD